MTGADLELHRLVHLVADAAIAADDALREGDRDALRRAIDALGRNADTARALAAHIVGQAA